jgi:hypothetical protein
MSRHRGAKPPRRYGRSGEISLLSPEYLLSVERWPFHAGHRITKTYFRNCSTYRSRSKARLLPLRSKPIANRLNRTFVLLRYSLGGDRPSQTAQLTLFPPGFTGIGLELTTYDQGGISRWLHDDQDPRLQRLPPILRRIGSWPISAYSKGPRGLSVLLRVGGIFTATTISPSRLLRQCSGRYAIHARRNLPDKELRYLRTVIVTAAVYRGFGRELRRS